MESNNDQSSGSKQGIQQYQKSRKAGKKLIPGLGGNKQNQFLDWEVGNNYKCEKLLGSGSYGQVAEAIQLSTGKRVAIKKMDNIFDDETDCKRILREITLLRKLRHPCVVELIEICVPSDPQNFKTLYVVMEFAESDLKKILKSTINLEILHIQTIVYNLLCAIKYLHESKVIHRDLKPANILVNEDCSVKLCDYGLARSITGVETAEMIIKSVEPDEPMADSGNMNASMGSGSAQQFNINMQNAGVQSQASLGGQDAEMSQERIEELKKDDMRSRLQKTKDARKNMKRELTGHVVTRWYRAPEIILLEKDYGPAIDIWAVGCIFAELLGMMKENAPTFMDRQPLFPGKSCFPLSPAKDPQEQRKGFPFSATDQLAVIFNCIGTPNDDDKSFVTDQKAIEYLDSFPYNDRVDLMKKYPGAPIEAIDFLQKILVFNPYFRMSLEDSLNHPMFENVRRPQAENFAGTPIELEFEGMQMDKKVLRELFLKEIYAYQSPYY